MATATPAALYIVYVGSSAVPLYWGWEWAEQNKTQLVNAAVRVQEWHALLTRDTWQRGSTLQTHCVCLFVANLGDDGTRYSL